MRYIKIWLIVCCIMLWWLISRFDVSHGYFEYKYYCDIQTNVRITISLKPETETSKLCLSYIQILDQNIKFYSEQVKAWQAWLQEWIFNEYRQSYLDETQPKLLQSRVLHRQIINSMSKFEADLFQKTMLYIRYRYKNTRNNLINNLDRRTTSSNDAITEGNTDILLRMNKKYRTEKRKLEVLNLMFAATNFNELMPFYTMYKQWEFDY